MTTLNRWSELRRIRTRIRVVVKPVVEPAMEAAKKDLEAELKKMRIQWEELRGMLMRVLRRFPDAHAAVVAGIEEIVGERCQPELAT